MGYREELQPASFRGVPFGVRRSDRSGGRRLAVHEFPGLDFPVVQDLGARTPRFRVEAFVLGDDYFARRDALANALDERGNGFLIHPTLGTILAAVASVSTQETWDKMRVATFSIEFVRVGLTVAPLPAPASATAEVDATAADVERDARDAALADLKTQGVPESAREAVASELRKIGRTIDRLDVFAGVARDAAELGGLVVDLIHSATELAASPPKIISAVVDSITRIRVAASTSRRALGAYEALGNLFPSKTGAKTGLGALMDKNAAATIALARATAMAGAAQAAARADWETYDEAVEARARLSAAIGRAMESTRPAVFERLGALRSALRRAVPPEDRELPRLLVLRPSATTNVLSLAYEVYGDVDRADEITARNRPVHPGFIPGQEPVEVVVG